MQDKKMVEAFNDYVKSIKAEFDVFDRNNNKAKQITFLQYKKYGIFKKLDNYFKQFWEIANNLNRKEREAYFNKYNHTLKGLFGKSIEINRHIYSRPFGYSGDYKTMNYIFDYTGNEYIGKTSFQRLINNYTCNIPFARSNIVRKNFIKSKIASLNKKKYNLKILSVGSGPMRELIELIDEGKIINDLEIVCLDIEKRAINYVKNKMNQYPVSKKKFLKIHYLHKNIIDLLKMDTKWKDFDFIYASGLFDYLTDSICKNLTRALYKILNEKGYLLICNASSLNVSHRAYYEFLGRWIMLYRKRTDMVTWTKNLFPKPALIAFEKPSDYSNYLFLSIVK